MGPSHKVLFITLRLFQHGCYIGQAPARKCFYSSWLAAFLRVSPPSAALHALKWPSVSIVILHYGLLHGLHRNLCSNAWSTFSPPVRLTSSQACVSAGLFLSYFSHSSLSQLLCSILCYFSNMLPLRCPHCGVELTGTHCVQHGAVPASLHSSLTAATANTLTKKPGIESMQKKELF